MVPIKDGEFFILTRRQLLKLRDSMKNLDSISTDHSTLSQNFHSTELLSVLELTTLSSRDGERMFLVNNTTSTRCQRLSDLNNGRTMQWKFNPTVDLTTSVSHLASTLDGGNYSNSKKEHMLSIRKERLLKYQEDLITKTKTLSSVTKIPRLNRDGKSSMLMSIQLNQLKENSTRNSVSMLREISTLYLHWIHTDISI
jgi:hypothetical protein